MENNTYRHYLMVVLFRSSTPVLQIYKLVWKFVRIELACQQIKKLLNPREELKLEIALAPMSEVARQLSYILRCNKRRAEH